MSFALSNYHKTVISNPWCNCLHLSRFSDPVNHNFQILEDWRIINQASRFMNINITYSLERNYYLEWSIKNWGDKSLDILSGNFSGFSLVFCHVIFCQVDQADGWDFLSINSKEFWDTAVVFNISVNKHKENLSFEFLSCGWKCFLDGLEIFSLFACKEQNMLLNISSKDLWCILEEDKIVLVLLS